MKEVIIVSIVLYFLYKVMQPSKGMNKSEVADLIGSTAISVVSELEKQFERYEKERQIALDEKQPNRETEAFWVLKNYLREFPDAIKTEINKAKNQ